MRIIEEKIDDQMIEFTLKNEGMSVSFLNLGGAITQILVPDKHGVQENIVLVYKDYGQYYDNAAYLGVIVGRVAGRIKGARFDLNDQVYNLTKNEGDHHLHGGHNGLHQVIWKAEPIEGPDYVAVKLSYTSEAGLDGYPGTVSFSVTYELNDKNEFNIDYEATSDKDTILALTNHSYFNLSGHMKARIDNHYVRMKCDRFVALDDELIAMEVQGDLDQTPFDFNSGRRLGDVFQAEDDQILRVGSGYDHYFLFEKNAQLNEIVVHEENSGRAMHIYTDQPGVVMYTANGFSGENELRHGKDIKWAGVCLETQCPPDSLWLDDLPSIVLLKDELYRQHTSFRFGTI